jgi:hypothetical protein
MRTTAANVKAILDNTALTTAQIEAYITSADIMITQVLGTTLGTDTLSEISRWLTAHMIATTRERPALREEAGTAKIEYTGKWGLGLASTSYGAMVLSLDTTGAMAAASTGLKSAYIFAVPSFDE